MNEERNDGTNNDDKDDIYNDIGDFHFDRELTKLEESNKGYIEDIINLTEKLKQLMEQNSELQTKNDILVTNISTLLKTSKAEIERKQLVIDNLRKMIDSMNVKNKYNNKDFATKEFCESCAKLQSHHHMKNKQIEYKMNYEQFKDSQNSLNIEEGEIVSDNCEQQNIAIAVEKNEDSDNAEKASLGNHRKKKKNHERSRKKSTEKHSNEYKRSNHQRDNYSRKRRSSRSRKRHHSRDRRHSERTRSKEKSREKKNYSSRSGHHSCRSGHRSRYSSDKSRNKSSEKVEPSNVRHSSPYERNSRSRCEGESKDRKDKKLEESVLKARKPKETEVKTSIPDNNFNKKPSDYKKEKINSIDKEISNKERNISVKKMNVDEYHQRRNALSNDQGNNDIQRYSVLDGLYDNSINVNMSVITKVQARNDEDKVVTKNEFGIDSDSCSERWYQNNAKKPKPSKKPKTLYSKRMEAKILQQLHEEATDKLSNEIEEQKSKCNEREITQKEFDEKPKRINTKENVQEKTVFEEVFSDVVEKEKGEISVKEFIDVKFDKTNDEGGKVTKSLSFQNTIVRLNTDKISSEMEFEFKDQEKNNDISGKTNDSAWKISELCHKAPDSLPLIKSVKTPEQSFGESLFKKLLQLQRSQEPGIFKEFSPLKNNYKLLEISPLKATPRQHILEYYNLKFCTHQLSNIEPEGFDLSLNLPITPGKDLCEFSGLTDPQESVKGESDDASDKLKILDEDKIFENDDKMSIESSKTDDNNITDDKFRNEVEKERFQEMAVSIYGKSEKDDKKGKNNNKKIKSDLCSDKNNSEICHSENCPQNKKQTEMKLLETNSGRQSNYYMRTRRSSKIDSEKFDKKDSEWDVKRGSVSVCGKKASHGKMDSAKYGKIDTHKRKRSIESSDDEDSMDDFVEAKKKKTVKRNANLGAGQKNKKDAVERLEDCTMSEFVAEEMRKVDNEKSLENFKTTSPADSADADVSDNTKNVLEDLSLSNSSDGRVTASNSMMSFMGDVLCLESSEKFVKTDEKREEDFERAEHCNDSENSPSFKLRKYFMGSANEESEPEDLTESGSGSSGEYSDSGASAFIDLL